MIEVAYVAHMGSDLLVVNAARRSFDNQHTAWSDTPRGRRGRSDAQLVSDLARDGHLLPFRHPQITLACTAPLPIARQLGKHQVGMCLSGDTEVTFTRVVHGRSNGKRTATIRDLHEAWTGSASKYRRGASGRHQVSRGNIRVLNTDTGVFETGHIVDVSASGPKPVYLVTLTDGASLKMSKDHRVYTDAGWEPLETAVGLIHAGTGRAAMTRACRLGRNGTQARGADTYRNREWMASHRAAGSSVDDIARAAECSYHNARKWLRLHGLQFNPLDSLTGSNGKPPWNKGASGYTTKRVFTDADRAVLRAARSGKRSNFWRGGVTSERASITAWTLQRAPRVHEKFAYTCQMCGEAGGKLVAHHVVPVHVDPSLGKAFGNLVTVCRSCHVKIHRSPQSEMDFAALLRSRGRLVRDFVSVRKPHLGNTLRVHFVEVAKVEFAGVEETFDIAVDHPSHNFVANGVVVHNSWSEVSRRYRTKGLTFHQIAGWRADVSDRRQGSGEPIDQVTDNTLSAIQWRNIQRCMLEYEQALEFGASPEQARFLLPQSMDVAWTWTGSLLGWAHLYQQRTHPDVQAETREFAVAVADIVEPLFPVSWAALAGWRINAEGVAA